MLAGTFLLFNKLGRRGTSICVPFTIEQEISTLTAPDVDSKVSGVWPSTVWEQAWLSHMPQDICGDLGDFYDWTSNWYSRSRSPLGMLCNSRTSAEGWLSLIAFIKAVFTKASTVSLWPVCPVRMK